MRYALTAATIVQAVTLFFTFFIVSTLPNRRSVPVFELEGLPIYDAATDTLTQWSLLDPGSHIFDFPYYEDRVFDTTPGDYGYPKGLRVRCHNEPTGVHLPLYDSVLGVRNGLALDRGMVISEHHGVKLYRVLWWWLLVKILFTGAYLVGLVIPLPLSYVDPVFDEQWELAKASGFVEATKTPSVSVYVLVRTRMSWVLGMEQTASYAICVILLLASMGVPWTSVIIYHGILASVNVITSMRAEFYAALFAALPTKEKLSAESLYMYQYVRSLLGASFLGFLGQAFAITLAARGGSVSKHIEALLPPGWERRDPMPLAWTVYIYAYGVPVAAAITYMWTLPYIFSTISTPGSVLYAVRARTARLIMDTLLTSVVAFSVYFELRGIFKGTGTC